MGWRIVKQPNGLLSRFSDIVDDFTHMDLTHDEAVEACNDEGCDPRHSEQKVKAGEEDHIPWTSTPGSGLDRWNDCIKTVRNVHGDETANERIKTGSDPLPKKE